MRCLRSFGSTRLGSERFPNQSPTLGVTLVASRDHSEPQFPVPLKQGAEPQWCLRLRSVSPADFQQCSSTHPEEAVTSDWGGEIGGAGRGWRRGHTQKCV